MPSCFSSMALAAALLIPALAQEAPTGGKERATGRGVRFLAVGDMPPFRQEIRDGVAYELEPPAGSVPPREVRVGEDKEGGASTAELRLGRVSALLPVPAGEGPLPIRSGGEGSAPWLTLNRPAQGNFLVLLWRDPAKGTWDGARALVLPDDAVAAPAGRARYVNLTPVALGVGSGGEKIKLEPGKIWQEPVPAGKDLPFELSAVDRAGALRKFHTGALYQNPGERTLVVIYRADGVQPRRPFKVVVHREPVGEPAAATPAGGSR